MTDKILFVSSDPAEERREKRLMIVKRAFLVLIPVGALVAGYFFLLRPMLQ